MMKREPLSQQYNNDLFSTISQYIVLYCMIYKGFRFKVTHTHIHISIWFLGFEFEFEFE